MERTKLLTITIIGLLLLNIATLFFLFVSGPNGHKRVYDGPQNGKPEPKEIIIERLHFDANQQKEYSKLIEWHRGEIRRLDNNIRKAKNDLYSGLSQTEVNAKTSDSLISLLNSYQKQIEQTHFKHFEDIKKLCKPEQREDFNDFTQELAKIFAPKPRSPRHE